MKDYSFFHNAKPSTFSNARALRNNMTAAEKALWKSLRRKQIAGLRFRRQHPVGNFILDFYCHDIKLAIEVDGPIHDRPEQKEYDQARDQQIRNKGIQMLRFSNDEVFDNIQMVIEEIKRFIPHP
ncbi:DNA methylase, putative [Fulvivirga imtechensis AK7]|uniref:DNA methylase, putative n=1 Tax=Fulvivirga imtechensis AK7 TaxID=1237149 RepID=L8JJJ9_9BACT|nr:endonuclease domain-containing protein [Fulvivirga imtechensis]ELR68418.1 DNA methylase, putative [Fulvivirga imtechensis AK7]